MKLPTFNKSLSQIPANVEQQNNQPQRFTPSNNNQPQTYTQPNNQPPQAYIPPNNQPQAYIPHNYQPPSKATSNQVPGNQLTNAVNYPQGIPNSIEVNMPKDSKRNEPVNIL